MLDKVIPYVDKAFEFNPEQIRHFERTLHWVRELSTSASQRLEIAAYAHDIQRSQLNSVIQNMPAQSYFGFLEPAFLRYHQEEGALMMEKFLKKEGYDPEKIFEVRGLIRFHEYGGTPDGNLLMDADSISFFETQISNFTEKVTYVGVRKVREKLEWMFRRISLPERQKIAEENYRSALEHIKSR